MIPRKLWNEYISWLYNLDLHQQVLRISAGPSDAFGEMALAARRGPADGPDLEEMEVATLHPDGIPLEFARQQVTRGCQQLELDGSNLSLDFLDKVMVGLMPTTTYNAQTKVFPSGYAVVVDKGLVRFLRTAIRTCLNTVSTPFSAPALRPRQAAELLAADLVNYILHEPHSGPLATGADPVHDVFNPFIARADASAYEDAVSAHDDEKSWRLAHGLFMASLRFALAHEYAHAYLGHLSEDRTASVLTPSGSVDVAAKSRLQEYEADVTGLLIHIGGAWAPPEGDGARLHLAASYIVSGPLLFFSFEELVSQVRSALRPQVLVDTGDHPPTADRRMRMARLLGSTEIAAADASVMSIPNVIHREVLPHLQPMILEAVRSLTSRNTGRTSRWRRRS